MQQGGCCDMYGLSVEKSMMMRMSPADHLMEPMELLERGASPPLSDSGSEHQNRSPPASSCENSSAAMEEAKSGGGSKKRRKQSNPLRYQTSPAATPMPLLDEALDLQTRSDDSNKQQGEEEPLHRCHHCPSAFESEDHLRVHVEEEHVQKALERQLQQYNKATSNSNNNNREEKDRDNSSSTPKSELGMMVVPFEQNRASPPDDYKTPHFPFPPMPPFIPFSRSGDDSKQGGMPMPLSMFPNPFLFPVIPQGQTPPSSNGTSHSGQGVRIFNLEAYCELCNKEFCNKYFLKTHKANKHGIYSVESIVSSPYGAPYLPTSLNSPIPLPHMMPPAPNSAADPLQPPRTGLLNMESYCEICQKEFCNKYFLKKHRQKIHGIVDPGQNISPSTTPSQQDTKSNSPVMTTCALSLTAAPSFMDKLSEDARDNFSKMEFPSLFNIQSSKAGGSSNSTPAALTTSASLCPPVVTSGSAISVSLPSPGQPSNENSVSHVFTPEKLREMGVINADAFCELCCKEFCNKYFLRTHKLNKHGINMPEISPGKQHSGPLPPSSHSQGSLSNEKGDGNYDDSRMSEGLLMDHTISFESTGTGELSCDFCNRPFSSLYLLKMHKFYTHNIPFIKEEESKSKPNSPSEENPNQENKENEFVKPHLPLPLPPTSMLPSSENNSTPTSLQEDAASQDLQKLQSMIRELNASAGSESSKIVCNLCKLEFDNKYFLRAHMMNEHGVLPNEDGHVPGHSNGEFGQSKMSESDFQRLNFNNSSPTIDSEAYCEICQKEFCSKYFLKTHKQNIHGIPVDMSSSTPKKSLVDEVYQIKSIVNNTFSSSLMPMPVSRSLTPNGGGSLTPSQSTPNQPPSLSPISSIPSHIPVITSNNSVILHNSSRSSPQGGTVSSGPIISSSTILTNSIGNSILTPSSTHHNSLLPASLANYTNSGHLPSNLSLPKMPPMSHHSSSNTPTSIMTSIAQMHPHLPSLHHNSNAGGGGGGNSNNSLCNTLEKPRNLTGRNYCNICNKELCNKYFMKTHMLKMHGINLDSQPHEAARISTIGGVQCDICQKELCSKYFLKVHKQNTHGIFEEGAGGGGGKELRELPPFLDKEQPMQGLDLSDPSGRYFSHYPEICPVCNCRFKSIKWLKAHMISDHGNILKENFPHPLPDLGSNNANHHHHNNNTIGAGSLNNNNNGSLDTSCLCVLCGQGFADKVALHVHLIKDHHSASDEANSGIKTTADPSGAPTVPEQVVNGGGSNNSSSSSPPPNGPPKPHGGGGSRIYHCSFCVYSTRWLSNLYAHEKRHTGVNTEGEKKFVCRVCHRAYRYNHSLQRHFLSHRAAGLSLKDMAQPLIMSSHSSGQLSLLNRPWNSLFQKEGGKKIRRYRCSKCSKKFRSRELCLAHIHAAHGGKRPPKGAKPFRCRFCGFQTRALNVLRIHINRQHQGKEEGPAPEQPPPPPNSPHLPMTFAMPQNPPTAGSFIMQPFLLAQPEGAGEPPAPRNGTFVPSLVYLPVCQKVSQPMTVAFTLTPA